MRQSEFHPGHAYVTVNTGVVPKFFTSHRGDDDRLTLGGSEYSSNGHWEWLRPGVVLVYVGLYDEDEYHEGMDVNRLVFLFDDAKELQIIVDPMTDVPVITLEQWRAQQEREADKSQNGLIDR